MTVLTTLRIAWRNLGRNWRRSLLALGAIAIGQFAFLATSALMRAYGDTFYDSITGPLVGHVQVHAPEWRDDRSIDLTLRDVGPALDEIRRDPNVSHATARIYAPVLTALTEDGFMSFVVGVDPSAEHHESGLLPEADFSPAMSEAHVLVGSGLAARNGIERGMEIAIVGQDVDGSIASGLYTVAEIVPSTVELVNSLGIVMTLADARELLAMSDEAHEILIHVDERELLGDTVTRLSSLESLSGAEVLPWREVVPQLVAIIGIMDRFLYVILFIVFIAAAAGIANTMLMSTFERNREFGMLLSLGCGPGRLSQMITLESIILGLLGVSAGTVLGFAFALVTSRTGLDYAVLGGGTSYDVAYQGLQMSSLVYPKLYPADAVAGVLAVFVTSLISVIWPVARIARLEPMEAMRS